MVAFRQKPHIDHLWIRPGFPPLINVQLVKTASLNVAYGGIGFSPRSPVIALSNEYGRNLNHTKGLSADSAAKQNSVRVCVHEACLHFCVIAGAVNLKSI